jgi:hypothetical protein
MTIVSIHTLAEARYIRKGLGHMASKTMLRPLGGETWREIEDRYKNTFTLTYNDLWMMIVCRTALDGDWLRTRQAASMVQDAPRKRALAERLWELEQRLDGLPEIPGEVLALETHRAHQWFKQRTVVADKRW